MHPLLTLSYWTSLLPPPTFDPLFLYVVTGVFGASLAAAVVLKILSRKLKEDAFWGKGAPKLATTFFWMGFFGFLHLGVAYEQTYLWGARFWLLVWAAGLLAWLGLDLHYILKVLPRTEDAYEEKMRIEKYLPKRK